ncbi:alpha/beta hydrolase family protein [Azospirillum picis]|uniref:Dienelactone hydrolase n=1 Tax=Azospirillum picis TaxID=488438 RepID=A0ABU0MPR7_9PROT|nr:alpha/beta hydrolase [Azospirillum picis]MBP2301713.1 putative dienelactone hydrolase [Azospirillum picis]MDQ0535463.1 putative dienelactone hydrolase [Azospirillum picis]
MESPLSVALALSAALCGLGMAAARAESLVGFQRLSFPEAGDCRAVEGGLWYPTTDVARESALVGDDPILAGEVVRPGAEPQPGRHALVVLSHGYGGNWTSQQWLAVDLARHGYVVAAPNHPGSTSRDIAHPAGAHPAGAHPAAAHPQAAKPWTRPREIGCVIDGLNGGLNGDGRWSGLLISGDAAVIGHSLGGWTAMVLAGGRFDPERLAGACKAHPAMAACRPQIGGLRRDPDALAAWARPMADRRIRAAVTLDLGLSQGFDPASLAAVDVPVLVVAAGPGDADMPADLESGHLADHLPAGRSERATIADAGHFSFLGVCKAGAVPLLEAQQPGGGMICRDGGGRDRPAIHRQTSDIVVHFMNEVMPPFRPPF